MSKTNINNQVQLILKVNANLKERTLQKVREDGITLKALLTMAMKGYVNNDLSFGIHSTEKYPSATLLRTIIDAENDLKKASVKSIKGADKLAKHLQNI